LASEIPKGIPASRHASQYIDIQYFMEYIINDRAKKSLSK